MALKVKIGADGSQFMREMDKVDKRGKSMGDKMKAAGKAAGFGIAAIGAAAVASAAAVGALAVKMIDIGENANTADDRLAHVVKQMGVFGEQSQTVSDRLIKQARAQSMATAVDVKSIKMVQAKLATFKELLTTADEMGGSFDRATQAALDLAANGLGTAEGNAIQLGKALNDPIKGMVSLSKSGVTFTAQEKDKIRTLVESNQMLKAQDVILTAIETQVKGTAEKTANGMAKIKNAISLVIEDAAKPLARGFEGVAESVIAMGPKIEAFMESITPKIRAVADTIGMAISEALEGDTARLQRVFATAGSLAGQAFGTGVKYGMRSLGSQILGFLDAGENLFNETVGLQTLRPKSNLGERAQHASNELLMRDIEDLIHSSAEAARALQSAPPSGPVEGMGGGSKFRYAKEGENSSFRDSSGRMLVLLENIARNTSPPTFANP
jgi:hypothetical protein